MVKGQTARADPVWPWVERGIEVSSYCPARLTLVLPKLRKLSVTRKRRKPPNINEGLVYLCFHVRGEVLVALVVKLSAGKWPILRPLARICARTAVLARLSARHMTAI